MPEDCREVFSMEYHVASSVSNFIRLKKPAVDVCFVNDRKLSISVKLSFSTYGSSVHGRHRYLYIYS